MNKQRRIRINEIRDEIRRLQFTLTDFRDRLDEVAAEEREAFDNLPESLQTAEKEESSINLEEQVENIEDVISQVEDLIDGLTGVIGEDFVLGIKKAKS